MRSIKLNNPLLVFFIISLLMLSGGKVTAQSLEKRITVDIKNQPLKSALGIIAKAGKINFSYNPGEMPLEKNINYKAKNKKAKDVLDDVLLPLGITYQMVEKQVVLKKSILKPGDANDKIIENNRYTLSGYARDKTTGEILIGAAIYCPDNSKGAISNTYGYFSLTLPEGQYRVVSSMLGYGKDTLEVRFDSNRRMDFNFEPLQISIKPVEVKSDESDSWKESRGRGMMKITPSTLKGIPGFAGESDPIKSLQGMPGIVSYGDGSSQFFVRGGTNDQNMILIDEAPVYNASHLFGVFTATVPDAVKNMTIYKDDFPVSMGGRLSSVVDLQMKDGNMERFGVNGSINQFATNLAFEGPLVKQKASYYIALRRSNLGWLTNAIGAGSSAKIVFSDFNAKFNIKLNRNNRIFWTIYGGLDDYYIINNSGKRTYGVNWTNNLGSIRWNHIISDKMFSNTTLYYSQYNYFIQLWKERGDYWKSSIGYGALKYDFSYFIKPDNTFRAGIEVGGHNSDPGNIYLNKADSIQKLPSVSKYRCGHVITYAGHEIRLGNWDMKYGLRLMLWQNNGGSSVIYFSPDHVAIDTVTFGNKEQYYKILRPEPRFSIARRLNESASLKFSYSLNYQLLQSITNSTSPFTSLEARVPAGPTLNPQYSHNLSLAFYHYKVDKNLQFSAEAYFRRLYNQIDFTDHAHLLLSPSFEGEVRQGKVTAGGIELMVRKTRGKWSGWIAYAYSRAMVKTPDVNNGRVYPAVQDRPHNISLFAAFNSGKRVSFSAKWTFMSGAPVTTPVGFYYYGGYNIPIYGTTNNDRLPFYHRLDFSFRYRLNKNFNKRFQHEISFDIYNVYARKNPASLGFGKIIADNGDILVPADIDGDEHYVPTTLSMLGFIPSLTWQFRF